MPIILNQQISNSITRRLRERENTLSPYAAKSITSLGRKETDEPSSIRTEFQRDRDRIIHCKAFRRLKHKTQVFLAPMGDHYVTRLTHTLEVSQIARTIARSLNLNEDLTEAIGLGHDMGHTPFGHIGEDVLNKLYPAGFKHNFQSLRIVDYLERDGKGLNLTFEVRQGIVAHSKPRGDFMDNKDSYALDKPLTLEAQICRISDAVAYVNHDLGDAFRSSVLKESDLPAEVTKILGERHSQRINSLVSDIVESSWEASGTTLTLSNESPQITMSPRVRTALNTLREFLFQKVYLPAGQGKEGQCARKIMKILYTYYCQNSNDIPSEYTSVSETKEQAAVDYIAGMTDRFALRVAENISPGIADPFMGRLI